MITFLYSFFSIYKRYFINFQIFFDIQEHHQQANKTLITNKRKCSNETGN